MENRKVTGIKPSEAIENIEYARRWMGCESDFSEEALDMAIAALKKLEAIQTCTPPSDDWEHYADRLYDIAYKSGYEEGKQETEKWTLVSEGLPEEHKWMGTEHFGTTISDEVYVTVEVPSGERITKHMHFQNGAIPPFEQRSLDAFYKGGKAVSWMPLPEPYQGDKK